MPTSNATDAELLARWVHNDREAYAVLVARHYGLVRAACRRQAAPGEDEDCTQAVFLILARKSAAAARAPVLAAWLVRVARFVCRNSSRIAYRRRQAEQAAGATAVSAEPARPEALDHLDGCLLKLPAKQRAAVTLHYLTGRTPDEVAAALGTSRDNTYQLISRGLAGLRAQLARRGVAVTGAGLAGVLAAEAEAAAASTPTAILACLAPAPPAGIAVLATGAWSAMAIAGLVPLAVAAGLAIAAGMILLALGASPPPPPAPPAPVAEQGPRPAWASAGGMDGSGAWADLQVGGVVQRFRWIQPGSFTMGSPVAEREAATEHGAAVERVAMEVQHQVAITQGYWLADSACTQELWTAIAGAQPSHFGGRAGLPVEQVSWDDVQTFLAKLNARATGRYFRLPSEAEWEYACRAGTMTATYAGDLEYLGRFDAPVLDGIAWYGGNSCHGWTGEHGVMSDWPGKQYPETVMAGTWPVKQRQPNAWGLYDMLGNVRQWCSDRYGDYPEGAVADPTGPAEGRNRVYRGGGWIDLAAHCRAGFRFMSTPQTSCNSLGFRLVAQAAAIPPEPVVVPPPPRVRPPADLSREEVERRLATPVSCDFQDKPFAEVAAYLEDTFHIRIEMSAESGQRGLGIRLKGFPLRKALDWMTRMTDTSWRIGEGVIVITTAGEESPEPAPPRRSDF